MIIVKGRVVPEHPLQSPDKQFVEFLRSLGLVLWVFFGWTIDLVSAPVVPDVLVDGQMNLVALLEQRAKLQEINVNTCCRMIYESDHIER